jgi:hypothetical protein
MRRIALTRSIGLAVLACALLPAGALADHHDHHRHHHARRARRFFAHRHPGNAGTVVSFTAGVLTIKLGDGTSTEPATTISGKVDERRTEIRCFAALTETPETPAAPVSTSARAADHGPGGGGNDGDRNGRGSEHGEGGGQGPDDQPVSQAGGGGVPVSGAPAQPQPQTQTQTQQQPQGHGDQDDNDEGEDRDAMENGQPGQRQCGPANLTPGAVVHEAQLRLDASGAVFEEIVLVV